MVNTVVELSNSNQAGSVVLAVLTFSNNNQAGSVVLAVLTFSNSKSGKVHGRCCL